MPGQPGRSGPPQNQNSVGNSGGGAPAKNRNACTHSIYSYLHSNRLPADAGDIERDLEQLRNDLDASVVAAHGEVDLPRAAMIQSAVRHEGRCRLLLRWLEQMGDDLTTDQRITVLRDLGRATDQRDATIAKLDIEKKPESQVDWAQALVVTAKPEGSDE